MSRVDEFNRKAALATKKHKDEEVIKEVEIKNSTIEKVGQKVAKQHGMTTEDIFMIIARDSVGTFMKMWNNSMESVVRETIQNEVRSVVKGVIQDELASAVRGFMKGIAMAEVENKVEEVEFELSSFQPTVEYAASMVTESFEKVEYRETSKSNLYTEINEFNIPNKDELDSLIISYHIEGLDPASTVGFKKHGSRYNSLYQKFSKKNPGRGIWKKYVELVLKEIR